jgi:hypothetical protein
MWHRLRDVAKITTGYPFREKVLPEVGGDVTVVQIKDIDADAGLTLDRTLQLHGQDGRYDRHLLERGDVLFQSRGSRHPVALVDVPIRAIAALGLHVLRPDQERVKPEYLVWYLNHPNAQAKFKDTARGSSVQFVSKGDLEEFKVPIPTLAIQEKIVATIRLCDHERKLSAQLVRLRQQLIDGATWMAATRTKQIKG